MNRRSASKAGEEVSSGEPGRPLGKVGTGTRGSHRKETKGEQGPSGEGGQVGCREVVDFPKHVSGGRRRARGGVCSTHGRTPSPPQPARFLSRLPVRRCEARPEAAPACEGRVGRPPAHNASGIVRCFGGSRSPACLFQSLFHARGGAGGRRACSRESAATRP